MKTRPFTRPTIVEAVEFLGAALSQAKFNQVIVLLGFNPELSLASAFSPSRVRPAISISSSRPSEAA
ncbi:MAG: hypothetical protein EON54_12895 [Alcaligenaceae bacterium]|nr:MAG: hypothetical protein EON54_12895 [Alcaligenaceae bacterium]